MNGQNRERREDQTVGKISRKAQPPEIVEREYGRYMIKAGLLQNTIVARAFPKPPSKFRHLVAEAFGKTADDAIEQLIKTLEALRSERRSLRRDDPFLASGVPTSDEYADALRSLSPGPKLLRVLHDHALSRRRGLRMADLATAGEFATVQDLLSAYQRLGTDILRVVEPDEGPDVGLQIVMCGINGDGSLPNDIGALQPELQDAVLRLLGSDRPSV